MTLHLSKFGTQKGKGLFTRNEIKPVTDIPTDIILHKRIAFRVKRVTDLFASMFYSLIQNNIGGNIPNNYQDKFRYV